MIALNEIQPLEVYLCEEAVDFFEKKGEDTILSYEPKIDICYCDNEFFRYYSKDGHHRLFALFRLGVTEIDFEPFLDNNKKILKRAREVHETGISCISDLEKHLLPGFLCAALKSF